MSALGRGTNGSITRPYVSPTNRIAPIINRRSPAFLTSAFQAAWATAESKTRPYREVGDSPIFWIERSVVQGQVLNAGSKAYLRVSRHVLSRQQFVCDLPARQRTYPPQPLIYRGIASGEIVAGFFLRELEISEYGQVGHGRPLTNDEGLVR